MLPISCRLINLFSPFPYSHNDTANARGSNLGDYREGTICIIGRNCWSAGVGKKGKIGKKAVRTIGRKIDPGFGEKGEKGSAMTPSGMPSLSRTFDANSDCRARMDHQGWHITDSMQHV